jgi:hypothetical protein
MTKIKTFEAFTHDTKKPAWVVIPADRGESYSKYLNKGNPIRIVWTHEDGTRKPHMIKNKDNLPVEATA